MQLYSHIVGAVDYIIAMLFKFSAALLYKYWKKIALLLVRIPLNISLQGSIFLYYSKTLFVLFAVK